MDREEILRRFEMWLDRTLAGEEPPQGIAAQLLSALDGEAQAIGDGRFDTYSIWAALTALTQEVKLQGRTFRQLNDTLAPVADLAPQLAEMQRKAKESALREVLNVLLDLRDRLGRGLDSVRGARKQIGRSLEADWKARLLGRGPALQQACETVAALEKGYVLTLESLDEVLAKFQVREINCQGRLFDPSFMQAVDVQETQELPEGTVAEVYRKGYELEGEVYRPAQVRVTRRPSIAPPGDETNE
jgi:molecular chaperone GrpE